MSHQYSDASVAFGIHASHAAGAWIALCALATAILVAFTPEPLEARIAAIAWVACAALEAIRSRALLKGARGARHIGITAGTVEIEDGDGRVRSGVLRPGSFVAPWLTIVRWRPEGAWFDRTIPLLPSMLDEEAFRRLRVVLRFG
jgi:toxin CptA